MKISRIIIADYQQFKYFDLDLRRKDGRIPDKICFIGKNGTGKTTLLKLISSFVQNLKHGQDGDSYFPQDPHARNRFIFEFEYDTDTIFSGSFLRNLQSSRYSPIHKILLNKNTLDELKVKYQDLLFATDSSLLDDLLDWSVALKTQHYMTLPKYSPYNYSSINSISNDFLVYAPAEFNAILKADLYTHSSLNEAQSLFQQFPFYHEISPDHLKEFWSLVTYQDRKRESDRNEYENNNLKKTKEQLINEFSKISPDFLKELSESWKLILDEAGLYFDYKNARKPVQLNDNLAVFFKLKNKDTQIPFHIMSTGMKHLILRLGYLSALYFNREVNSSILLMDEPENSLYPNLLYNIIETYTNKEKFPNTQSFFATHSPIVAAQFAPEERIILDFDEDKNVVCRKGTVPEGDDPNDILIKDFGIESILGEEGVRNWERFIELKILLNRTDDAQVRKEYLDEYLKIGLNYNFPVNYEVSKQES